MSTKFTRLLSCFLCGAAAIATTTTAAAKPPSSELGVTDIGDAFERAFVNESGTFFENRSLLRQTTFILGIGSSARFRGSFIENEMNRDAELVHILYTEFMRQQLERGPVLRTRDLESPYQYSLGTGVIDPPIQ